MVFNRPQKEGGVRWGICGYVPTLSIYSLLSLEPSRISRRIVCQVVGTIFHTKFLASWGKETSLYGNILSGMPENWRHRSSRIVSMKISGTGRRKLCGNCLSFISTVISRFIPLSILLYFSLAHMNFIYRYLSLLLTLGELQEYESLT